MLTLLAGSMGASSRTRSALRSATTLASTDVTFECDYPHQDSTWPRTREYAAEIMNGIDDRTVSKILRGNAIRMLGLPEQLSSEMNPSAMTAHG